MDHLQKYRPRRVLPLPAVQEKGWRIKQYALLADDPTIDGDVTKAAAAEALKRLPAAGDLEGETENHGIGFQIIHFAEVAVVSPVFYWQWGSVLAKAEQMRADWQTPTDFTNGVKEFIGCVWELDIVNFEVSAWKASLLNDAGTLDERVSAYLGQHFALNTGC